MNQRPSGGVGKGVQGMIDVGRRLGRHDVTVATGGAMGSYLENTCGSSSALLAALPE